MSEGLLSDDDKRAGRTADEMGARARRESDDDGAVIGGAGGGNEGKRNGIRATRHRHGNPFPGAKGLSCPAELWLARCHGTNPASL